MPKKDDLEDIDSDENREYTTEDGDKITEADLEDDDLLNDDFGLDDYGLGDSITPMEKHSDLLKQLTNFNPFIKAKINGWLGLHWDETKDKWIKDEKIDAIMNEKCAAWCIDYLKTYTRDNNIITNIGKEEYDNMISDIIDVVWIDIGTRTEDFGIDNNGDLHRVCVEMQHAAELILMGAGGGKYNELLSTATSRHETISYGDRSEQRSMMGMPQRKLGVLGKLKKALVGG